MALDVFIEIKEKGRIEDFVEEAGYTVKGSGKYLRVSEHSSLVINTIQQSFFWNSRGLQGDIIDWVQTWKSTDKKGAVEFLCRALDIDEPNWNHQTSVARLAARAREDALTIAARVFVRWFRRSANALEYAQSRGFNEETIVKSGLGFTGDGGQDEMEEMKDEFTKEFVDHDDPVAVAVLGYIGNVGAWINQKGILKGIPTDWLNKKSLPRIWPGMLVYPHMYNGRVVYFSCRGIKKKTHWNLPLALAGERKVYYNHVYGPSTKRVVIVEGQADAISLAQWGVPSVALAGTSADNKVLTQLKERHDEVYIGVDGDTAGLKAAHSLGQMLGPVARLIEWSEGKDCNAVLQEFEQKKFEAFKTIAFEDNNINISSFLDDQSKIQESIIEERIQNSRTYAEYFCLEVGQMKGAQRSQGIQDAVRLINRITDPIIKSELRPKLAKNLSMNIRDYNDALKSGLAAAKNERRGENDDIEINETLGGFFDDHFLEFTYDSKNQTTGLVCRNPEGEVYETGRSEDINGIRYMPMKVNNILLKDVVLFPSRLGKLRSTKELIDRIVKFITKNYDWKGDNVFMRLTAYYVLFTWVYDCFDVIPYLRALGDYGTGKTQLIWRAGHLCYRLMKTSGASTFSPVFRIINSYKGTLFLDEADFSKSDAASDMIKLLNTGYMKGVPLLRAKDSGDGNYDVDAFDVYGPKLIATRERFQDKAVESRCLTKVVYGGNVAKGIPRILPKTFYQDAIDLRNDLLAWRMHTWQPAIEVNDSDFDPKIEDRLNQVTMSLKKIIGDDREMQADITQFVREYNNQLIEERSQTMPAKVLEAIVMIREADPENPKYPELISEHNGKRFFDFSILNIAVITNIVIDAENRLDDEEAEEKRKRNKRDVSWRGVGAILKNDLSLDKKKRTRDPFKGRWELIWDAEKMNAMRERYGI